VVDTPTGQDSAYRSSQDCAATGTSDSAQQQMAKAAIAGSFIIAAPQPMGNQFNPTCPPRYGYDKDYLAGLPPNLYSHAVEALSRIALGRLSICLGSFLQPSLL
jgi:hypothetical protein